MRAPALLLGLLLAGCPTVEPEPGPSPTCLDQLPDDPFELGAVGETQIHPRSTFDGQRIWTAYNAEDPDGSSGFAVFVVARGCDGELQLGPFQLDEVEGNAVDPDLAVSGDRLLVAWQLDDGGAPWNLSIHSAALNLDGDRVRPDAALEMERDGAPYEGNAWMPRLVATPDGFALAGSRGVGNAFQAFVQRLDADGLPAGPSIDLALDPDTAQLEPAIAHLDGVLHIAWSTDLVEGEVQAATLADGGDQPQPVDHGRPGGALRLAPLGDQLLLAGHATSGDLDVFVHPWGGGAGELDEAGLQHSPGLAGGDETALLLWHDGPQVAADLIGAFIDADGALASEPFELPFSDSVAGYPADAVHLGGDAFFASWSQGDSPDLTLHGAFLR